MEYKIFGCKVNKYYLNKRLNFLSPQEKKDDYIIATCVVTDRAKNKFIKETIQQITNNKHIYLTGCAVFDKGQKMEEDKFYNIYPQLSEFRNQITLLGEEPNRDDTRKTKTHQFKDTANIYTKKFVVIQNGCDSYCSFCLTIHKRGKSQNISSQEIVQEINDFVDIGGKEIVITGINLAARGATNTKKPQENKFAQLLQEILAKTTIERIRISSLGPEFLNDSFFEVIKNPRFLPHFHLSIQSFSDKILKSMNRNYDSKILDDIITKLKNLDRPDKDQISIGTDIIVGFPGETDQDFQDTINGIQKYQIQKLHTFPFSAHDKGETIPANGFTDQIPQNIKKERTKQLTQIGEEIRKKFITQNKGVTHQVLIEEKKQGTSPTGRQEWKGWTGNYIQVELNGDYRKGEIIKTKL